MADELEAFMRSESTDQFFEPTPEQEELLLLAERGESFEFPESPDDLDYEPMSSPKKKYTPKSPRKTTPPKSPSRPSKSPSKSPNSSKSTKQRIDEVVGEIAEAVLSPSRNVEPRPSGSNYIPPEQGRKQTRPTKVTIDRTRARKSSPPNKVSSVIRSVDNCRDKKPIKPSIKSPSKSPQKKPYKPQSPKKSCTT
ncbi:muscle M-line assembly protein unc-89-like [Planococcus citri]|uniref:muscle M-line assembly protein unc-89-like n=1 Tax=Planococcus citri TaxID=170843 RepID=UPI0031F85EF1